MRARHRIGDFTLLSGVPNHPHINRLQRIVGDGRDAKRPVAVRACDAALKKSALINHIEAVADMRRQSYREPGQRQTLAARAAEFRIGDPGRLPAVRTQRLELDVASRPRFGGPNAERLDTHLETPITDPAPTRDAPV